MRHATFNMVNRVARSVFLGKTSAREFSINRAIWPFDATRDYAKYRMQVSLGCITSRFCITRTELEHHFANFVWTTSNNSYVCENLLKILASCFFSSFSFFFRSNEIKGETNFVRPLGLSSRIDFPGSQGVLYGGDARLPDYLRSSRRVCVRFFFGTAASLRWSSRVLHGLRKGLATPLASTSGRHPHTRSSLSLA